LFAVVLAGMVAEYVLQFLAAYDQLCEDVDGPGVKLAAWHLQLIGTKPDRQRQGIAKALIVTAEQEAAKDEKACFIETVGPTNVSHHGLKRCTTADRLPDRCI
jgi:GNAT superfamily N-acetyltransferase